MNRLLKSEIVFKFGNQVTAAQALGLHESRLSRILNWRSAPTKKERRALAVVFGEKLDSLLKGEDRPPTAS